METQKKVVVVTGAAAGIGRGIALAFAAQGNTVVLLDTNEANLQAVATEVQEADGQAEAIVANVALATEVRAAFRNIQERYGRVDILVNNAGVYPFVPFEALQEADWDKVLNVNLKSMFLMCQAALPLLPDGAAIVNVSSIASKQAFAGLVHYSASKGGVNAFTRGLALELAAKKIRVNAVAPGAVDTPGAGSANMSAEQKAQMLTNIPLGRQGSPTDIAEAVIFLASSKASYITGQVLVVDGGWTIH